jgi:hypothetical protein
MFLSPRDNMAGSVATSWLGTSPDVWSLSGADAPGYMIPPLRGCANSPFAAIDQAAQIMRRSLEGG